MRKYLAQASLGTEDIPTTLNTLYKIAAAEGMAELVVEDELFMMMLDTLTNECKKRCTPEQFNRYLLDLMVLYKKGLQAFAGLPENLVSKGFLKFKSNIVNLIFGSNNVELLKRYYHEFPASDLKTEIINLEAHFESLKIATENPKEIFVFVQQQLLEKQQQYYKQFGKAVELFAKFITANEKEIDSTWQVLLAEINQIKDTLKIENHKMTFEVIYEAAAYLSRRHLSLNKVEVEKLKAKIKVCKLMTDNELGNLNSNIVMKLETGLKRKARETALFTPQVVPVQTAEKNHITLEKTKDRLIIYLDKGLPTEIKLSLPNSPDFKYTDLTANKLKQFLEICYQLQVIPDKTPFGIDLTCGSQITPVAADRFIFMDDAKGPVKIASILGIRSYHVLTEPVVVQKIAVIKEANTKINELTELAYQLAKSDINNKDNSLVANTLLFIGKFLKLFPDIDRCFNHLLEHLPNKFKKECEHLNKVLVELAQLINVVGTVKLLKMPPQIIEGFLVDSLNRNIQIENVDHILEKIQNIIKLLHELNTTLATVSRKLEEFKNNYIDQIMAQRNSYVAKLKQPPSVGLADVLTKIELGSKKASSLFSNTPTSVSPLSESDFLTLQRLSDHNNPAALEALGSYITHHDKDSRRTRACYQLAYLYNSDPAKFNVLLEKIRLSEVAVHSDKSSASNANELARFNSLETVINDNLHLYGMMRLSDIYLYMANGDGKDNARYQQNLSMAFHYCEIAYHLISPQDNVFQEVQANHQDLLSLMQPEQIKAECAKLAEWYSNPQTIKSLDENPKIKDTQKFQDYLRNRLNDRESFGQYMAKYYQTEHDKIKPSTAPSAVVSAKS